MKVVVRADAGIGIGAGHVMRCLTLADVLRGHGADVEFICRPHDGHMIHDVDVRGYHCHRLPVPRYHKKNRYEDWLGAKVLEDAAETAALIDKCDVLIADHYAIDQEWELVLRDKAQRIVVIDDLANRKHDADILLDQTVGRDAADYDGLVPDQAIRLCGTTYALVRPEFAARRAESLARRKTLSDVHQVLISLGGFDTDNHTSKVLTALSRVPFGKHRHAVIVLGSHAPHLQDVRVHAATAPFSAEVRVDIDNMADVMAASDLAIGAAGSAAWERCVVGLPTAMLVLADNQKLVAENLRKAGAAVLIDSITPDVFRPLFDDLERLSQLSTNAAKHCDGRGAERVAAMVLR